MQSDRCAQSLMYAPAMGKSPYSRSVATLLANRWADGNSRRARGGRGVDGTVRDAGAVGTGPQEARRTQAATTVSKTVRLPLLVRIRADKQEDCEDRLVEAVLWSHPAIKEKIVTSFSRLQFLLTELLLTLRRPACVEL